MDTSNKIKNRAAAARKRITTKKPGTPAMDRYENFSILNRHEIKGIDFEIHTRTGGSGLAVVSPHGGGIEPGTMEVADGVAGWDHTFYCFRGMKHAGNGCLHIASEKFDEPEGIRVFESSYVVLAIHGCAETEEAVFLGGRDDEFINRLSGVLLGAGFPVKEHPRPGLKGIKPANLCNRGKTGRGAQIELSLGLRQKMFGDLPQHRPDPCKNKPYVDLVAALRYAIGVYLSDFKTGQKASL